MRYRVASHFWFLAGTSLFLGVSLAAQARSWASFAVVGAFVLFLVRLTVTGIIVTEDRVRVITVRRTVVLEWDQIERFALEPYMFGWPFARVCLRDGRKLLIAPIGGSPNRQPPKDYERAVAAVADLNAQLEGHQTPGRR